MLKPGPNLRSFLFGYICYFLVSVDCCFFFAFFEVFSRDFGFLYCRLIPDLLLFLNYFMSVSQ